jgi:hypothetical protein
MSSIALCVTGVLFSAAFACLCASGFNINLSPSNGRAGMHSAAIALIVASVAFPLCYIALWHNLVQRRVFRAVQATITTAQKRPAIPTPPSSPAGTLVSGLGRTPPMLTLPVAASSPSDA